MKRCLQNEQIKSWLWKFFESIDNGTWQCSICNAILRHGSSTSPLNRHLFSVHDKQRNVETYVLVKLTS